MGLRRGDEGDVRAWEVALVQRDRCPPEMRTQTHRGLAQERGLGQGRPCRSRSQAWGLQHPARRVWAARGRRALWVTTAPGARRRRLTLPLRFSGVGASRTSSCHLWDGKAPSSCEPPTRRHCRAQWRRQYTNGQQCRGRQGEGRGPDRSVKAEGPAGAASPADIPSGVLEVLSAGDSNQSRNSNGVGVGGPPWQEPLSPSGPGSGGLNA